MSQNPLAAIQQLWLDHFSQGGSRELKGLIKKSKYDGLQIYKDSRNACLLNHMKSIYPRCQRYVGKAFWSSILRQYVHQTPSTHYDINHYGNDLYQFIEEFKPAQQILDLALLCQIELRWHQLKAADTPGVFDYDKFSRLLEPDFYRIVFQLNPNLYVYEASSPIFSIWEINKNDSCRCDKIMVEPQSMIIWRNNQSSIAKRLSDDEKTLIDALKSDITWHQIVSKFQPHGDQSIEELLQSALHNQWIVDFDLKEET